MMKFIKKYYISLTIVIVLLCGIIVALQQSVRTANLIKQKSEEFTQIQLDYALAQEFLNEIHKFKQDNVYLKEFYNQISFFLPNDDDEKIKLFSALEKIAKETNNESLSIAVIKSKVNKEGEIKPLVDNYLHLNLNLVGNYNDLIYFMTKLENAKYFSEILSFDIKKTTTNVNDEVQRVDLLSTKMDIVFYLESDN